MKSGISRNLNISEKIGLIFTGLVSRLCADASSLGWRLAALFSSTMTSTDGTTSTKLDTDPASHLHTATTKSHECIQHI